MGKFDANSNKKNFSDLAVEFYPFWKPVFEHLGVDNPVFKSKLCYNSNEFEEGKKVQAVRFFKGELDGNEDIYLECCDWNHNFYNPMERILYRLPYRI